MKVEDLKKKTIGDLLDQASEALKGIGDKVLDTPPREYPKDIVAAMEKVKSYIPTEKLIAKAKGTFEAEMQDLQRYAKMVEDDPSWDVKEGDSVLDQLMKAIATKNEEMKGLIEKSGESAVETEKEYLKTLMAAFKELQDKVKVEVPPYEKVFPAVNGRTEHGKKRDAVQAEMKAIVEKFPNATPLERSALEQAVLLKDQATENMERMKENKRLIENIMKATKDNLKIPSQNQFYQAAEEMLKKEEKFVHEPENWAYPKSEAELDRATEDSQKTHDASGLGFTTTPDGAKLETWTDDEGKMHGRYTLENPMSHEETVDLLIKENERLHAILELMPDATVKAASDKWFIDAKWTVEEIDFMGYHIATKKLPGSKLLTIIISRDGRTIETKSNIDGTSAAKIIVDTYCEKFLGDEPEKQYNGCGMHPHSRNPRCAFKLMEPLYLNLFEVQFPVTEELDLALFNEEIISCSVELDGMQLIVEFEDNLTEENEMIVFSKLLKIARDKIKLPEVVVSVHNRKGDVYLQYKLAGVTLDYVNDGIQLDYRSGTDILKHYAVFSYESYELHTINEYYKSKEEENGN